MGIVNSPDVNLLFKKDKLFTTIHQQYGLPPDWSRVPGFTSLSQIILEQQVSLASAKAHFLRLQNYMGEFTPTQILKLSDEEMRSCHISRQKAKYLRALATAVIDKSLDLNGLSAGQEQDARAQLTAIKGIGKWTTDIYLIFCLQAKDIFPTGDIALNSSVRELCRVETAEEIIACAEQWKPLRSLAACFLWHYYLCKRNRS